MIPTSSANAVLTYVGINKLNRVHTYHSTAKRCRGCVQKPQCTRGKYRIISIHTCEAMRQKAYELAKTPEFAEVRRERRKQWPKRQETLVREMRS